MKYIAVILIAGGTYLGLVHKGPFTWPSHSAASAPTPGTDFLKRPLDRTQEVLKQARTRAADPALQ